MRKRGTTSRITLEDLERKFEKLGFEVRHRPGYWTSKETTVLKIPVNNRLVATTYKYNFRWSTYGLDITYKGVNGSVEIMHEINVLPDTEGRTIITLDINGKRERYRLDGVIVDMSLRDGALYVDLEPVASEIDIIPEDIT